jgi:flagellar motor switch protein FliG
VDQSSGRLAGDKRVAALLLSLDQELAAKILKNLGDDQLDKVTRAMKELQEISVDRKLMVEIYEETLQRLRKEGMALGDVGSTMDNLLVKAFGENRGADVSERANHEILARRPFAMFEALTGEDLANLLTEEHPQIAAVFLAHLDREKAGKVLVHLSDELKADIMHRVATLDRTPPDVVQRVLDVMRQKVKNLGLTSLRSEPKAWVKAAAEILNHMGGGEKNILEKIAEEDEGLSTGIREEMFTFEDLANLDKKSMQKILSQVDTRALALALKAVPTEVEENVLGNLSKRAANMIIEERDSLGPTPLSEVMAAQNEILVMVRDLMDSGDVKGGGAAEELV